MVDTLYFRLAEVTGREVDQSGTTRRRGRSLTTAQAIGYGLNPGSGDQASSTGRLSSRPWSRIPRTPQKIALCTHSLSIGNIEPRG